MRTASRKRSWAGRSDAIATTVFLGGWRWPAFISNIHPLFGVALFVVKVAFMMFMYIWIRASQPRVRFDKLMKFSWQFMFPLALLITRTLNAHERQVVRRGVRTLAGRLRGAVS